MDTNDLKNGNFIKNSGGFSSSHYSKPQIDKKFDQVAILLFTAVIILLVMVATLLIDSFHFNSAVYKEYSDKIEFSDDLKKMNSQLLEQNNQNKEMIMILQKKISNK